MQPKLCEEAKVKILEKKKSFLLGNGKLSHKPDTEGSAEQGWGSKHQARLPPQIYACPVLSFSLKFNFLLSFGAAPSSSPWMPFLCSDPPRLPQCKDCSDSHWASCKNLSCYFVSLPPFWSTGLPNASVPWETTFQQKKREKEKQAP